ncbi:MAG: hypothetical protein IJU19_07450 [Bacteroidales bacterium]|nr:hypothetical protein [Bacteroidales bacterium]
MGAIFVLFALAGEKDFAGLGNIVQFCIVNPEPPKPLSRATGKRAGKGESHFLQDWQDI